MKIWGDQRADRDYFESAAQSESSGGSVCTEAMAEEVLL